MSEGGKKYNKILHKHTSNGSENKQGNIFVILLLAKCIQTYKWRDFKLL